MREGGEDVVVDGVVSSSFTFPFFRGFGGRGACLLSLLGAEMLLKKNWAADRTAMTTVC